MGERRPLPAALLLAASVAALFVLYHAYHVFIPFALSLAIAYIMNPVIANFETRGLRREFTIVVFYAAAAIAVVLIASTVVQSLTSELRDLQAQAPLYAIRTRRFLLGLERTAARRLPFGPDLISRIDDYAFGPLMEQVQSVPSYLLGVFPVLSLLFLIPFITFFLLIDGPRSIGRLIQACPSRYVEQALHLISEIDASLGAYLRGLIVVAAAIGLASFVGLAILGVNQALAIAFLSGISSFVPYLGAVVGAVVGGLIAGFQFGTVSAGLKVVLLFAAIRFADEALLQPLVAKHSVKLHPLLFLLTFMLGGELLGFVGLVFAVPAACVIKALVKVAWSWYSTEARLQVSETADAAVLPYT